MSLSKILIDELRDLYSAENQLVKAMPKLVKSLNDPTMKQAAKDHLEETKGQVQRLRQVFEHMGKKATGKHCSGMEGCIEEVTEALGEDYSGALKDSCILGAALRAEHYEIAGYTAAIAMAKTLGQKEVATLLEQTLKEETEQAKKLVTAGKPVLKQAMAEESEKDDAKHEKKEKKDPKQQKSEKESVKDEKEAAPVLAGEAK